MATCKACLDPKRAEIEAALANGLPFRQIAARFGVPTTTLCRHKGHMTTEAPTVETAATATVQVPPPGPVEVQADSPRFVRRRAGCSVCGGNTWWRRPGRRWLCAECFPSGRPE